MPGSLHIGELNERFGLTVPQDDYTTIGGFVFGSLGRLPVVGDRVAAGGAVFTVRQMDGRRIESVAVDVHRAQQRLAEARSRERSAIIAQTRTDSFMLDASAMPRPAMSIAVP